MSSHTPKTPSVPNNNPDWTDNDIAYGPLIKWTLSLWVLTAIVFAVLIWWFRSQRDAAMAEHPVNAFAAERMLPPGTGPLLQANPIRDLDEYKAEMAAKLTTYGVIDKEKGVYRIPVDQAITRILEKGELK